MAIVSDNIKAWNVLKRLHNAVDGSFMFSNINDKFKIVIRNDPEGGLGHYMNVAVLVKVEEDDDILMDCLDNVADAMGWADEEKSEFVFAEFELDRSSTAPRSTGTLTPVTSSTTSAPVLSRSSPPSRRRKDPRGTRELPTPCVRTCAPSSTATTIISSSFRATNSTAWITATCSGSISTTMPT